METTAVPKLLPHLWKSTLLSGIMALTLGILVYVLPGHSLVVAAALFGIYLLVTGAAQVFFAFSLHVTAGGRVLLFISGAASLVLAVLCFRHFGEGYAILLLAIWIGIGFIFRGVATSISAISDPHLPGRGWQIFLGLVSLLAGIVMLGVAVGNDRDLDADRRHLADRHRGVRNRVVVRYPQRLQEAGQGSGRRASECGVTGSHGAAADAQCTLCRSVFWLGSSTPPD